MELLRVPEVAAKRTTIDMKNYTDLSLSQSSDPDDPHSLPPSERSSMDSIQRCLLHAKPRTNQPNQQERI